MSAREFKLKLVVQAIDKVSAPVRRMGQAFGRMSKNAGLDRVASAASDVGQGLKRTGREALKFGKHLATGAAVAGGGLIALVKKTAAVGDQIAKTADKLGVGVKELQRLRYAAELSGVSTQTFDMALQRFTRRAAEAASGTGEARDALAALGIQLTDTNGNLRPSETLLGEVADKMARIEDPARRVRIAFKLFDSEGVSMVNMLGNGADAMRAAGAEAEQFGLITEEQARASEKFNDNMTRLMRVVSHLGLTIANELIPHFNDFVVYLRTVAIEARPAVIAALTDIFQWLGSAVDWVKNKWALLTSGLEAWQKALLLAIPALGAIFRPLLAILDVVGSLRATIAVLGAAIGIKLVWSILALFGPLAKLAASLVMATIKMTLLAASGVKALISGLVAIAPMLATATAATWAWTAALLANPLTWIVVAVIAAIAAIAGAAWLIYKNWDGIVSFFTGLWGEVKAVFDGFIQGVAKIFENFKPADWIAKAINALIETLFSINLARIGHDWMSGLGAGMAEAWQDLTSWLESAVSGVIDWMPDWAREQLGLDIGTHGVLTAPSQVQSAIAPARQTQVGGTVKVQFENAPANMRIRDVSSKTPDFGIDVDAGYAMAGTG